MRYEILLNNRWLKVSEYIWRSFTGARCRDGKVWQGPRYILGTEDSIHENQVCNDLCLDCAENVVTYKFSDKIGQDIICSDCSDEKLEQEIDHYVAAENFLGEL